MISIIFFPDGIAGFGTYLRKRFFTQKSTTPMSEENEEAA